MKRSRSVRWYPDWVYSSREDVTRANMALYEKQVKALDEKCIEICPNYYRLDIVARFNVRRQADDILHHRPVREPLRPRS